MQNLENLEHRERLVVLFAQAVQRHAWHTAHEEEPNDHG